MQRKQQQQAASDKPQKRGRVDLDRRYGQIGISAVAAAVRYQDDTKAKTEKQKDFALALDRD
jgi:hypothetical protein